MWLATVSALGAAVSVIPSVANADSATKSLETWQLYGYIVFAGLFALLAWRPKDYRGIWELVIFNKAALTITALAYVIHGGIDGASTIIVWDGGLTIVLIAAYILCQGWKARVR